MDVGVQVDDWSLETQRMRIDVCTPDMLSLIIERDKTWIRGQVETERTYSRNRTFLEIKTR